MERNICYIFFKIFDVIVALSKFWAFLTALFTKLLAPWLLAIPKKLQARMPPRGHSCQQLPLKANGHFSLPQELYHLKSWLAGL